MRSKTLTFQIFILFLISTLLFAQSNKKLKEKINNIKGDVSKIVVSTENGDISFEGDDAKKLFKRMKSKTIHKNIEWISDSDHNFDSESDNILIFKSDNDIQLIDSDKEIQIEVEEENGEKTLTVITTEDGEEKIETFNGTEADKYLDKMEEEHNMLIDVDIDFDSDKDISTKKIIVHSNDNNHKIEEKVKVEVEDGKKKITITTTKDGEEKVKVLEGEEAEKYLKENDGGKVNKIIKKVLKR